MSLAPLALQSCLYCLAVAIRQALPVGLNRGIENRLLLLLVNRHDELFHEEEGQEDGRKVVGEPFGLGFRYGERDHEARDQRHEDQSGEPNGMQNAFFIVLLLLGARDMRRNDFS